tara:strand:- start:828 stop:1613 length:786 start_codon:yes stop_codon:yes gene_type:complete
MIEKNISVMVATHIIDAATKPYIENEMIIKTIKSSHEKLNLGNAKYYVYIDAVMKRKFPDLFSKYLDFLNNKFTTELKHINIEIVEDSQELLRGNWEHMINNCPTPYFLFLEHDWEFTKEVPTLKILEEMDRYERFSYLRFPYTKLGPDQPKHWDETWGGYFEKENEIDLPLTGITFYSGNPHIVKTIKCRNFYLPLHKKNWSHKSKGTSHLEKELAEIAMNDVKAIGKEETHKKWGCFLYGTWDNFDPVVSHLGDWCRKR